MKLPKSVLGALLVGLAVQTTGCKKEGAPEPKGERVGKNGKEVIKAPVNCPACGMG